ncbi:MAG: transposase [Alphaproteobacteria bacterium]|nr:transposase [Alphaproteobacteria bacterium]
MLYAIVEQHADAFFAHIGERDAMLPGFVRDEFDAYLRCGRLEHGFLRVKCTQCRHEHLVAFSCKCRGFCPSCSSRRMIETASHLVDHVLPQVPIRQWVLSFPWPLRLLFAARPEVLTQVLNVLIRALSTAVVKRAGLTRSAGGQTGIVTFIQRFGSALNLNIHLHMLVPDGAYTFAHGQARFHRAPAPTEAELERLLQTLIGRITRALVLAGVLVEDPEHPWLDIHRDCEDERALEQLAGAAVRYRIAVGPIAGRKTMTLHSPGAMSGESALAKTLTTARDGFSLNAAVVCKAHQRDKLERLCRYVSRGPIALERLSIDGDGLVVHELKHPFRDGTTHVLFEPLDFLARLAALVPRPRAHLVRYHGLFAPNAKHRHHIVTGPAPMPAPDNEDDGEGQPREPKPSAPMNWIQRLRRVFDIDLRHCPRCAGPVRVIAAITEPALIARILKHRDGRDDFRAKAPAGGPRAPPALSLH